ncbi:MAG: NifU family protein [Flavobacteriales bacterium]|nr:MAG: NifU family protein [Flavobacteriales bacterium]
METQSIPTTVYAESTPNPATMKFVANQLLIENGAIVEYTSPEEAEASPLAAKIFNFPFVTGIFIAGNFISVTKNDIIEWEDVTLELREYVQQYLRSGQSIFANQPTTLSEKPTVDSFEEIVPKTDIEEKIVEILEDYIRPAVEQDGGAIHFKSFNDGVLTVILRGACSGCPSSMVTLKAGIQGLFERMLPEVKEVVAEEL